MKRCFEDHRPNRLWKTGRTSHIVDDLTDCLRTADSHFIKIDVGKLTRKKEPPVSLGSYYLPRCSSHFGKTSFEKIPRLTSVREGFWKERISRSNGRGFYERLRFVFIKLQDEQMQSTEYGRHPSFLPFPNTRFLGYGEADTQIRIWKASNL